MIEKDVEEHMDTRPPWRTWQESKPDKWGIIEDVVELLTDICMDTAAHTLQGEEVLANLDKSIKQCLLDLEGGFGPLNFIFPAAARSSLPPANRRRDVAQAKMSRFYLGMIADRRAGKTESTHDILATLLHQSYRDGRPLSDLEIAHMLIAILMAGHHESASTASWILLLLAENPNVAYVRRSPDLYWLLMVSHQRVGIPGAAEALRQLRRLLPPLDLR
jgi:sterol 14-demethylase